VTTTAVEGVSLTIVVPLRDRMRRARAQQADLFVSIHADSIRDRSIDGSSVYILSQRGATDEASRWLANARMRRLDRRGIAG